MENSKILYEDRKKLMEMVNNLKEEELWKVIEVIYGQAAANSSNSTGKEFEINFGTLNDKTCIKLARLVKLELTEPPVIEEERVLKPVNTEKKAPSSGVQPTKHKKSTKPDMPAEQPIKPQSNQKQRNKRALPDPPEVPAAPRPTTSKKENSQSTPIKPQSNTNSKVLKSSKKAKPAPSKPAPWVGPRIHIKIKEDGDFKAASVMDHQGNHLLLLYDEDLAFEWVDASLPGLIWLPLENLIPEFKGKYARLERLLMPEECHTLLRRLLLLEPTEPFREPVDPSLLPQYYDVVDNPMDLGKICSKMANGGFSEPSQVVTDVITVCRNALAFNPPDHEIYKMAQMMVAVFHHHWFQLLEELDQSLPARSSEAVSKAWSDQTQDYKEVPSEVGQGSLGGNMRNTKNEITRFGQKGSQLIGLGVKIPSETKDGGGHATIISFDEHSKKHLVEFEDGSKRKLDLDASHAKLDIMPPETDDTCMTLRTGVMVWARAAKFPWWPAEIALPDIPMLLAVLRPPTNAAEARLSRRTMVLYAGESQFDLLTPSNIERFSFSNLQKVKSRISRTPELPRAYKAFTERCKELEIKVVEDLGL